MKKVGKGTKVFVGLSGGVDSSVSAALLKEQGYGVTGVFIKVWHPDFLPCTWREERRDAMRVAARLGIPFVTIDLEKEYKKEVADYMIEEYRKGRTPNPDVMCNKEIKFGSFFKRAMELGADYIATGHYAVRRENTDGTFSLCESPDKEKDQSYFLWTLQQDVLKKTLFPVGSMTKPKVRKLAEKYALPTAEKKDSQGICFLGKVEIKEFLSHYMDSKRGNVLDTEGNVIGEHDGAIFMTLGQRHGFKVNRKTSEDEPLYVVAKDISANTVTVAPIAILNREGTNSIILDSVNWVRGKKPHDGKAVTIRARYRQEKTKAILKVGEDIRVEISRPMIAPPGQSLVIYDGEECLGGGVIR